MSPELVSILIQIPIVAAFVWFVLELEKRFSAFLTNQLEVQERQTRSLDILAMAIIAHDSRVTGGDELKKLLDEYRKVYNNHEK